MRPKVRVVEEILLDPVVEVIDRNPDGTVTVTPVGDPGDKPRVIRRVRDVTLVDIPEDPHPEGTDGRES